MATLVLTIGLDWRIAFWIGASIAMIGAVARTALRETTEFADARRRLKNKYEEVELNYQVAINHPMLHEKANDKTTFLLFLINCAWPICFYFAYMHCGNILKTAFNYTSEAVIHHNLIVSIVQLLGLIFISYLSYRVHPLKILKTKLTIFIIGIMFVPYFLSNITTPLELLLIQGFIVLFAMDTVPAVSIFFKHFPVFKRFTYSSVIYALSRAMMYIITSFGIIYLTKHFGSYGILMVIVPINIGCVFGLYHFEGLEKNVEVHLRQSTVLKTDHTKIA